MPLDGLLRSFRRPEAWHPALKPASRKKLRGVGYNPLIDAHFFIDASKPLAGRKRNACLETETEKEKEAEKKGRSGVRAREAARAVEAEQAGRSGSRSEVDRRCAV